MIELLTISWPWITGAFLFLAHLLATSHIVLNKRDNRAALGWVGLNWFVPLIGPFLYVVFGINRVQRRAKRLRRKIKSSPLAEKSSIKGSTPETKSGVLEELIGKVTGRPLTFGNEVRPFLTGEETYIEMIKGIETARRSVCLSTYIFANDHTGDIFANTLANAVRRGVSVRVLIDGMGSRYSFPPIVGRLRNAGVPVACFLPSLFPWTYAYAQLRNHRKILLIDGHLGFTGGMNISDGHDLRTKVQHPITDCHFRIQGPVINNLRAVFADDWEFATGERLSGATWFPALEAAGNIPARAIASGPDDDIGALLQTFLGAIACARQSVRIVTPYFVPDSDLVSALRVAALRGVQVDILVPSQNNLRLVHWAMTGQLNPLLECGCRVWLTLPPFDHSKLFLVDDEWSLLGSANWDSRSLRLNFELDVECYDRELNQQLNTLIEQKLSTSKRLTMEELNKRPLLLKLRDGIARLASPYL